MSLLLLVVDDESSVRRVLARVAERMGHRVLMASTGPAGIVLALQEGPDAILLDVNMPDLDGRDVIQRLKAVPETAAIPVFILSGTGDEFTRALCLEYGAEDYFVKPFEAHDLLVRLERWFATRPAGR